MASSVIPADCQRPRFLRPLIATSGVTIRGVLQLIERSAMASTEAYDQAARDLRRAGAVCAGGALDAKELIRYATLAASSHNTQPWRFRVGHDSITVLPDFSRRCPAVDPDDSHLFKSLGCAAENIVHAAAAQGFSTEVRFDPEADGVIVQLFLAAAPHVTDLFSAIPKRQCARTVYDGASLGEPEIERLRTAGEGGNVRTIILLSDAQKNAVADFVRRGDFAQLTDPRFRDELVSWLRFTPGEALSTGDGLSGRASGQPALPRWLAKWMIGLVLTPKGQAETDAINIRSSAGVAVFVSRHDDKTAWVEVGRVYERFALQAAALDVRTAFINQPIEVRSLRAAFESWLNLDGEHALLMVRFGHGPAAPFSLRRPIADVIIADQSANFTDKGLAR